MKKFDEFINESNKSKEFEIFEQFSQVILDMFNKAIEYSEDKYVLIQVEQITGYFVCAFEGRNDLIVTESLLISDRIKHNKYQIETLEKMQKVTEQLKGFNVHTVACYYAENEERNKTRLILYISNDYIYGNDVLANILKSKKGIDKYDL